MHAMGYLTHPKNEDIRLLSRECGGDSEGTENVRLGVEDVFREWLEAHLQLLFRAFLYPGDRAIRYKHEGVDICVHTQAYINND
jgi:hypothetical protein